jgi:hypothetical protein
VGPQNRATGGWNRAPDGAARCTICEPLHGAGRRNAGAMICASILAANAGAAQLVEQLIRNQ